MIPKFLCYFLRISTFHKHKLTTPNSVEQKPKVHHRIYKRPLSAPILSQLDPLILPPPPPANFPKTHFDPILPSYALVFQVVSFLRAFPPKPCTLFSPVHACRMACPPHSPWFYLRNYIWGWLKIMKLLTVHKLTNDKIIVYIWGLWPSC
jgi:hypothetical protein